MTRRAWWLVAAGYALLALGVVVAQVVLVRQGDKLEAQQERLARVSAAYCEAIRRESEVGENFVLVQLAFDLDVSVSQLCGDIKERIEDG